MAAPACFATFCLVKDFKDKPSNIAFLPAQKADIFCKPTIVPIAIAIEPKIIFIAVNSSVDPVKSPNIAVAPSIIKPIGSKAIVNILSNAPTGPPTKSTNIPFIFSTASVNFCCASLASNL